MGARLAASYIHQTRIQPNVSWLVSVTRRVRNEERAELVGKRPATVGMPRSVVDESAPVDGYVLANARN